MWSEAAPEPARCPPAAPRPAWAAPSGSDQPTVDGNDPLVGVVVDGRYRVLWPFARGGMARLYEVDHLGIGRRFGLKVMHPHLFERPALRARFEREARAAARTRCPWVVDVVDLVHLPDGRPAIVTEWLDGEDLEARLAREERIPLDEALAIAADVCRGLAAAHRASVIHRDLKPANVFLPAPDGTGLRAKILDFGVAKIEGAAAGDDAEPSPLTHAGSILGTPAYMAPEQARGADEVDARADVYGVGALLYRMRTGIPPHPIGDATATLQRVLRDEPRRPTDLDPEMPSTVEAVIQRAMARRRELRYPTVTALAEAIEALRGSGAAPAPGPVSHKTPAPPEEPPGRLTAVAAGLGLGLVAASATALLVRRELAPSLGDAELRLLRALAMIAGATVSFSLLRRIKRAWPSGPSVGVLRRALSHALLAALACFGALELRDVAGLALDGSAVRADAALHALAAAALACGVFAVRRPRLT